MDSSIEDILSTLLTAGLIAYIESNPEKIDSLIVQNGCAYEEGLEAFWDPIKAYWKNINDKEAENTLRGSMMQMD